MTTLMNERTTIGGATTTAPRAARRRCKKRWTSGRSGPTRTPCSATGSRGSTSTSRCCASSTNAPPAAPQGGKSGPEGSIAKLQLATINKDAYDLCIDLLGADGLVGYDYTFKRPDEAGLDAPLGSARKMFLRARANSIEGGTSEIMRNILGERILGLPGEPRVDRDVPWSQVPRN